ncbi:MAG: lipoprotein, partial [Bacillota bacterium]
MKKLLALIVSLVIVFTLAACGNGYTEDDTADYSYTSVDINPAVEFVTDEDDTVVTVYYANDDAEVVAADLDLVGLPLEEAIELYIDAAIETGYIDVESNENIITITNQEDEKEDAIKEDVEAMLAERRIGAAIFGGEMNDEYTDLADQYDIGYGRARLVSRAAELDDELTFEEALDLPHDEIMAILIEEHQTQMDEFIEARRAAALDMKDEMKVDAQDRVQTHRDAVDEGEEPMPDFDAIRSNVQANIDDIRANYENRIEAIEDRIGQNIPNASTYTYTSIDINPAIEFVVDEDNIVVSVYYANEDAEIVATDLELVGLPLDEAIEIYIDAAIETGYIDVDSNENIITVTNPDDTEEDAVKDDVEAILSERGIGAAIFGGEMSEDYVALAEEYDIDVGRARLVSRAADLDEDLTFEEALELPHRDIMTMLVTEHRAQMDEFIIERRADAEAMKNDMRAEAMDRVQSHRD